MRVLWSERSRSFRVALFVTVFMVIANIANATGPTGVAASVTIGLVIYGVGFLLGQLFKPAARKGEPPMV